MLPHRTTFWPLLGSIVGGAQEGSSQRPPKNETQNNLLVCTWIHRGARYNIKSNAGLYCSSKYTLTLSWENLKEIGRRLTHHSEKIMLPLPLTQCLSLSQWWHRQSYCLPSKPFPNFSGSSPSHNFSCYDGQVAWNPESPDIRLRIFLKWNVEVLGVQKFNQFSVLYYSFG